MLSKCLEIELRGERLQLHPERALLWPARSTLLVADPHFGKTCRFFDTEKRSCTIYKARPAICRDYPGGGCGYYSFLMAERSSQEDPDHVASTWNA